MFLPEQYKKCSNKGIKSFYPVTCLNGSLNLLPSSFPCSKPDNIFTLFDLLLVMNWNTRGRTGDKTQTRNGEFGEMGCHKILVCIPVFCEVLNLQLLTSV